MRPVRSLLMRIPDRRVRRWVTLGLLFAVSLLIGRLFEFILHPNTLNALHTAQQGWIQQVQAFTPLELVKGYGGDVQAALRGEWTYNGETPSRDERLAAAEAYQDRRLACDMARLSATVTSGCTSERAAAGRSASECAVNESLPGCAALMACLSSSSSMLTTPSPPECEGVDMSPLGQFASPEAIADASAPDGQMPHPLLVPVAALSHGVTRLFSGGIGSFIIAGLQIVFGFAAFVAITSAFSKTKQPGFGDGWANYIFAPIAVIGLGSLLALVLQWLMLGALYLFSWITGFAAAAAGATGVAGGCWWCFTKLTEKTVEGRITK